MIDSFAGSRCFLVRLAAGWVVSFYFLFWVPPGVTAEEVLPLDDAVVIGSRWGLICLASDRFRPLWKLRGDYSACRLINRHGRVWILQGNSVSVIRADNGESINNYRFNKLLWGPWVVGSRIWGLGASEVVILKRGLERERRSLPGRPLAYSLVGDGLSIVCKEDLTGHVSGGKTVTLEGKKSFALSAYSPKHIQPVKPGVGYRFIEFSSQGKLVRDKRLLLPESVKEVVILKTEGSVGSRAVLFRLQGSRGEWLCYLDRKGSWLVPLREKIMSSVGVVVKDSKVYFCQASGAGYKVTVLSSDDGALVGEQILSAKPKFMVVGSKSAYLILETSSIEEKLDSKRGEVVVDLVSGRPLTRVVTGFEIWDIGRGVEPRKLASYPRSALLAPSERVDGVFVFATQDQPQRTPGRGWKVDLRYPAEPVVLRGIDLDSGELWSWVPSARGEGPDKRHLPIHWPVEGHKIYFLSTDGALSSLDLHRKRCFDYGKIVGVGALNKARLIPWGKNRLLLLSSSRSVDTISSLELEGELSRRTGVGTGESTVLVRKFVLSPWFVPGRLANLLGVILLGGVVTFFLLKARRQRLFVRKIAGLDALDEAVGRATEMGRPVLYVTGFADVDDVQTLASLSILRYVAYKTALYDTPILVPTSRSVVLTTAQEVVKEAFTEAGRPDAFQPESVRYISDDQFGYAAGVDGIIVREKPAANFFMGTFYAESLIMAETGHTTGAIQIAGTAMPAQLPFFVAACDYTLIGEELYAASAYLSQEPQQIGSLRGQDVGKAIVMVILLLGCLAVSLGYDGVQGWLGL